MPIRHEELVRVELGIEKRGHRFRKASPGAAPCRGLGVPLPRAGTVLNDKSTTDFGGFL